MIRTPGTGLVTRPRSRPKRCPFLAAAASIDRCCSVVAKKRAAPICPGGVVETAYRLLWLGHRHWLQPLRKSDRE